MHRRCCLGGLGSYAGLGTDRGRNEARDSAGLELDPDSKVFTKVNYFFLILT